MDCLLYRSQPMSPTNALLINHVFCPFTCALNVLSISKVYCSRFNAAHQAIFASHVLLVDMSPTRCLAASSTQILSQKTCCWTYLPGRHQRRSNRRAYRESYPGVACKALLLQSMTLARRLQWRTPTGLVQKKSESSRKRCT